MKTSAPRPKKRLLGACILLMMTVLAVGTLIAFAEGKEGGSSYSLVIQKVFAEGAPTEAQNQIYTFRVEAQVKSGDGYKPVEEVVKIKGEDEATVDFGSPFKVSIIEQTDGGDFKVGTDDWNVSKTECVSEMHVNASQATVRISKDNGRIEITRAKNLPTVAFQLTGKPLHENNTGKFTGFPKTAEVAAGQTVKFENLPQGEYTITKLRAADGFSVLVGERKIENVPGNEKATVHINGSDSRIAIKAPDPVDSIVRTHYYQISGGNSYTTREIEVFSGQTGIVEHLSEGDYTIEVAKTYDGAPGYKVKYPSTTVTEREVKTNKVTSSDSVSSYRGYTLLDANKKIADQVEVYNYGPVYDADGNPITTNVTYKVNWGIKEIVNGELNSGVTRSDYRYIKDKKGSLTYTIKGDSLKRLTPGNNFLYFTITSVSDPNVATVRVKWREYRESVMAGTVKNATTLANGKVVTVNGLTEDYIIIEKPADTNPRGGEVNYYYTINDSNGNLATGVTITDLEGNPVDYPTSEEFDGKTTTVTLKAGQSVKISGLKNGGNYRIFENIQDAPAMPFTVTLEDTHRPRGRD